MPFPTDTPPGSPHEWTKTHESETAAIWRNGVGDVVTFTQSFNEPSDYWEVTDTTGQVTDERAFGPFDTYLDALAHVNKFLPRLGREELPDDIASIPDDEVVEVGSYPSGATDRECTDCGTTSFVPYRVEYGDESHEWLCPPCASERFGWDTERDTTVTLGFDGEEESIERMERTRALLEAHADALVDSDAVDVNTLSMVLKSMYKYKYDARRDDPDDPPAAYGFQRQILHTMTDYREEHPEVSWADLRDALEEMRRFAHEYARQELGEEDGRRTLIHEIQQSELTPNEWFAQNADD